MASDVVRVGRLRRLAVASLELLALWLIAHGSLVPTPHRDAWLRAGACALLSFGLMRGFLRMRQARPSSSFRPERSRRLRLADQDIQQFLELAHPEQLAEETARLLRETLAMELRAFLVVSHERLVPLGPGPSANGAPPAHHPFLAFLARGDRAITRDELEHHPGLGGMRDAARDYFDRTGATAVVPLVCHGALIGVLHLDLDSTSPQRLCAARDRDVLERLRPAMTIALVNALSLRYWNEELADEVQQQTQELRQRSEELARASRELEHFIYVASHDLQEPLRVVAGFAQLLARRYETRLDGEAQEFLRYLVSGVVHMQRLIEGLLAYSRVGTTGQPLRPTSAQAVVERVLKRLQSLLAAHGATVTIDPLPVIPGDAAQLEQLVEQLLDNALKFRAAHPLRIHIAAQREPGAWRIDVRDNGIGLDPQYAEQIFALFRRLHPPDEYPGTGIGLAVCKKIVERHGGRIWVESSPGPGATFCFTLPDGEHGQEVGAKG